MGEKATTGQNESWIKKHKAFLILLVIYLLVPFTLDTLGKFGIVDDSPYLWSMQKYVDTGSYHWNGWSAMSLVGQLWLALPLVKLFGVSYGVLRIFALFMGLICFASLYFIALNINCRPKLAALIAAGLCATPVFYRVAFSFMTDATALAMGFVGLLLQIIALKRRKPLILLAGGVFTAYSILIRQNGIFWCLGLLLYVLFENRQIRRQFLPWALLIVALNFGTMMWYNKWSAGLGCESLPMVTLTAIRPDSIVWMIVMSMVNIGLVALPFVLGGLGYLLKDRPPRLIKLILLSWTMTAALVAISGRVRILDAGDLLVYLKMGFPKSPHALFDMIPGGQLPAMNYQMPFPLTILCLISGGIVAAVVVEKLIGSIMTICGSAIKNPSKQVLLKKAVLWLALLNTILLPPMVIAQHAVMEGIRGFVHVLRSIETHKAVSDALTAEKLSRNLMAYHLWLVVIAITTVVLWVLYFRLKHAQVDEVSKPVEEKKAPTLQALLYWAALTQLLGTWVAGGVMDRYFLPAIPMFCLLVARRIPNKRFNSFIAIGVILIMGMFSWSMIHDVASWNQARNSMCQKWLDSGISPNDIEAGFCWNVDHGKLPLTPPSKRNDIHLQNPFVWDTSLFPEKTGKYTISFTELPGYTTVSKATYSSIIPLRKNTLYGLRWNGTAIPAGERVKMLSN
ncbi:MAG: glycosyltransferase family 39 protein [Armatimonadota bacterium]